MASDTATAWFCRRVCVCVCVCVCVYVCVQASLVEQI
jgi:hypothetical protein